MKISAALEHADHDQVAARRSRRRSRPPSSATRSCSRSDSISVSPIRPRPLLPGGSPIAGQSIGGLESPGRGARGDHGDLGGRLGPSRNSSLTATPATQATRPPAVTTGIRERHRARHAAVGEQVLQALAAAEAERADPVAGAPARISTSSPSAAASSVASSGPAGSIGSADGSPRCSSQSPNRADPGIAIRTGSSAAGSRPGREPDLPASQIALQPAAELDLAALGAAPRGRRSGPPGRDSSGTAPAGRPLGELAQHQPAQRRPASAQLLGRDRGRAAAGAGRGERLGDEPLEQLRLLVQLGVGGGDVALDLGADLGEHRQHLVADPVAGVARGRRCVGSSTNGSPASSATARVSSRSRSRAAGERPCRCAAAARAAAGFRARRRAGRGSSRRGRCGCDRSRSSRAPSRVAQPLGGRVAGLAGAGLDVALAELGALDVEVDAELRAERPRRPLVVVGVGPQAVVEVQGGDRFGPAERDQPRRPRRPSRRRRRRARRRRTARSIKPAGFDRVGECLDRRRALHAARVATIGGVGI